MLKHASLVFGLFYSLSSHASFIDFENLSPGLDIEVQAQNFSNRNLVARVTNHEPQTLQCVVKFYNGPQTIRTRKSSIESQQQRKYTHYLGRAANHPKVTVNCR